METIHAEASPLAAYLEGELYLDPTRSRDQLYSSRDKGEGIYDPDFDGFDEHDDESVSKPNFAPSATVVPVSRLRTVDLPPLQTSPLPQSAISRLHYAWSTAVNSRLCRTKNAKFLEHFRYIFVASQLLNEYLDQGALHAATAPPENVDVVLDRPPLQTDLLSVYGALATAVLAFALVYVLHWVKSRHGSSVSKSQAALIVVGFILIATIVYTRMRRHWLKFLRNQAVNAASCLTNNWQAYELSSGSSLSFIQEVELVSRGYKISTPMPPISRIEDQAGARRCARLRSGQHKAYDASIRACIDACASLRPLIDSDDLERYYDVYDISLQDAREALGLGVHSVLDDDPESLKSLRVLSYRSSVLRRITLCSLMALEADGGTPDFHRWRVATAIMAKLSQQLAASASRLRQNLSETETLQIPPLQTCASTSTTPVRERFRSQVRKISMLSSGIRGLQAKMQILREETNHSLAAATDDLVELGPDLLVQYDAIGQDLRELMQAWETGRTSLQHNMSRHERRRSLASISGGLRSPATSLGGLTAVDEAEPSDSSPTDAFALDPTSKKGHRSSLPPGVSSCSSSPSIGSDESAPQTLYEAVARPRQRARSSGAAALTREERIVRMHEERERQAQARARRDVNTSMLRELESVINLRPKKGVDSAANPPVVRVASTSSAGPH